MSSSYIRSLVRRRRRRNVSRLRAEKLEQFFRLVSQTEAAICWLDDNNINHPKIGVLLR